MLLSSLASTKVDLGKPVLTLDVHGVALRDPATWSATMQGLAPLEWNYFKTGQVELCVGPELTFEITGGQSLSSVGWRGYQRFKKSQLFKSRPSGATLSLTEQQANTIWTGVRQILWPRVKDVALTAKQRADVSEVYFHTVANSTLSNSAFLTCDRNTLRKSSIIQKDLGVAVMTFTEGWQEYRKKFSLHQPTPAEVRALISEQRSWLNQLSTRSSA